MDKTQFMAEIANILDEVELSPDAKLRDCPSWDSLSVLSIVALADSKFGFTLAVPDLKGIETAEDLWAFFETKRTK